MAKQASTETEFKFEFFSFPKPELDRKMAIEWLWRHYSDLAAALRVGYFSDEKGMREDFAWMSQDLSYVAEACIHVLRTGKPVRVRSIASTNGDFPERMLLLARVMAQRHLEEDRRESPETHGFDKLTRMFVERIEPAISDRSGDADAG